MSIRPEAIQQLQCEVQKLIDINTQIKARIVALEEGACRFHCRTAKENWIAGLKSTYGGLLLCEEEIEEKWREWKRRQTESTRPYAHD